MWIGLLWAKLGSLTCCGCSMLDLTGVTQFLSAGLSSSSRLSGHIFMVREVVQNASQSTQHFFKPLLKPLGSPLGVT